MRIISLSALMAASVSIMSAGIIVTPEAAGVTHTTVANTVTEDFNSFSTGAFSGLTPIGTYSSGGRIVAADTFSGDGTKYLSTGAQSSPSTSYTLTFNAPQTFFGLLWNAMDAQNSLTINTNGGSTTYTSANFTGLSNAYKGNPGNTSQDSGEFFVYLDFSGTLGTTFNSVTFSNSGTSTGFETDNHSILASTVPEPSTYGMLFAGFAALAIAARRRSARKF